MFYDYEEFNTQCIIKAAGSGSMRAICKGVTEIISNVKNRKIKMKLPEYQKYMFRSASHDNVLWKIMGNCDICDIPEVVNYTPENMSSLQLHQEIWGHQDKKHVGNRIGHKWK